MNDKNLNQVNALVLSLKFSFLSKKRLRCEGSSGTLNYSESSKNTRPTTTVTLSHTFSRDRTAVLKL